MADLASTAPAVELPAQTTDSDSGQTFKTVLDSINDDLDYHLQREQSRNNQLKHIRDIKLQLFPLQNRQADREQRLNSLRRILARYQQITRSWVMVQNKAGLYAHLQRKREQLWRRLG